MRRPHQYCLGRRGRFADRAKRVQLEARAALDPGPAVLDLARGGRDDAGAAVREAGAVRSGAQGERSVFFVFFLG